MPRNYQPVEFNTFVGGLVTEASPLNFPTNASLDEENFVLNKDGTRSRRLGMGYESGFNIISSTSSLVNGDLVVSSFKWSNAGGLSTNTIICVQMGDTIDFFKGNVQTISLSKFFSYTFPNLSPIVRFSYAAVDGKLIVATGQKQVSLFTYDTANPNPATAISVSSKNLLIRDLFGLDDGPLRVGTGISTRPTSATGQHIYNLRNQGWAVPRPKWAGGDSPSDVISDFASTAAGKYPSNADNITPYIYANTTVGSGSKTVERFDVQNLVSNSPSNTETPIGYFIIDALDRGNSRQAAVADMASKYPVNSASLNSLITGSLGLDETPSGARSVCEFAGRIFYSGFQGNVVGGDLHSPKLNSYLLFSQLVHDEGDINLCYQAADPTDPASSDLVDTDGGFIRVEGAYNIVGMAVLQNTMFVLAENGVWAISGGSQGGFTATNYQVAKLTGSGCISIGSVVVMQDSIFYWGLDGIYAITRNEFGDFRSNNITNKTIKRYYMSIPDESIRKAEGVYDSYDGYVKWIYNNFLMAGDDVIELNLDVNTGAYFKLRIKSMALGYPMIIRGVPTDPFRLAPSTQVVTVIGGSGVTTADGSRVTLNSTSQVSGLKEIVYLTLTDDSHYTFSGYNEPYHYDWVDVDGVGIDSPAYLLTGVLAGGDYQRSKQIVYQTTHFGKTETPTTPMLFTSRPYPVDIQDNLTASVGNESGVLREILHKQSPRDNISLSLQINSGVLKGVNHPQTIPPDFVSVSLVPNSGVLKANKTDYYIIKPEAALTLVVPNSGVLKNGLVSYMNYKPEAVSPTVTPTSGSLSTINDPYFSSVASLLHFNGTNGSTTFTDQIGTNSWAASGTGTISTAQSKFGGASGNFPVGTFSPIQTSDKTSLQMGSGDFTIEGWFNPVTPSLGYGMWYCKGFNTTGGMQLGVTPTAVFIRCAGTTDKTVTTTVSAWSHIAWVRSGGTTTIYVNGISVGSTATVFNNNDTGALFIGSANPAIGNANFSYGGYVDDVRITKGVARYTANFTPPTAAFPNS